MAQKIVLCGAGFLGSNIATVISKANNTTGVLRRIQVSSRNPNNVYAKLKETLPKDHLLPPVPVDVTKRETLTQAFQNADAVISLVGILQGSTAQFEAIQWKGAENVARVAAATGAKLVHVSAIGADPHSNIPYARTKALGEEAVLSHCPDATIIRPSLVFGPGDGLFNRFAQLSRYLPVLPVFGKGDTRFQPVYAGDIGRLIDILTRDNVIPVTDCKGKIIEAVGPEGEFSHSAQVEGGATVTHIPDSYHDPHSVLTFRQMMKIVVNYTGRFRPIVALPWVVGEFQAEVMQLLPQNIFTITRDQIEQLKVDNVATYPIPHSHVNFKEIMEAHSYRLTPVHDVLPTYLK